MQHSIKEHCIQHVVTALQGIKQAAGYNVTIQSVQRVLPGGDAWQTLKDVPAIFVTEGEEEIDLQPLGCTTKKLILGIDVKTIQVQHANYPNLASACNGIEADIERAVLADPQRSAKALDTVYVGREEIRQDEDSVEFRMRFLLLYRHRFGDPYQAV